MKLERDNPVRVAEAHDLQGLVSFLASREIDNSFKKPLSERDISIPDRVRRYYDHGFWVFDRIAGTIYSCIAALPDADGQTLHLSTFAIRNCKRGKKLGADVYEKAIAVAKERYRPRYVVVDSWEGNKEITLLLKNRGYIQTASYYDKSKRPPGVKTVVYRLELP